MDCKEEEGLIFVRMYAGEDFFEGLEKACRRAGAVTAVVVSAVGMLSDFELGYFRAKGDYAKQLFKKPHELVALSGLIIREPKVYNFHLHAALADEKKRVKGGHLFSAKVRVTAEIVLLKSGHPMRRELDEETGIMGLKV
jgi:predicted DNA-binding protein with PD1-like motif